METLPKDVRDWIDVRRTGSSKAWGNLFLLDNFNLYIDWNEDQHDMAMDRLGIDKRDVILSGHCTRSGGLSIRGSSRCYDIFCEADYVRLFEVIREILKENCV